MRISMGKFAGQRWYFYATVGRCGRTVTPKGKVQNTLLLKDIYSLQRELLTDHSWIFYTSDLQKIGLKEGDRIQFSARVLCYQKSSGFDYRFSYIKKVKKLQWT